jgi:hypothetical protein
MPIYDPFAASSVLNLSVEPITDTTFIVASLEHGYSKLCFKKNDRGASFLLAGWVLEYGTVLISMLAVTDHFSASRVLI